MDKNGDWEYNGKMSLSEVGLHNPVVTNPPRLARLTYSREKGEFKLWNGEKVKRLFYKEDVNLLINKCPNGRVYFVRIELQNRIEELRFTELDNALIQGLHMFFISEVGMRKGSLARIPVKKQFAGDLSGSSHNSTYNERKLLSSRSTHLVPAENTSFKDEKSNGFAELTKFVSDDNSSRQDRKRHATFVKVDQPIRTEKVFNSKSFISSVDFNAKEKLEQVRKQNKRTIFDKSSKNNYPHNTWIKDKEDKAKLLASGAKRQKTEKVLGRLMTEPLSSSGVVDEVFNMTFANGKRYNDRFDELFSEEEMKENFLKKEAAFGLTPPFGWNYLPDFLHRDDFWEKLPQMKGLREGTLGEWVKGLNERLTIEGLLTLEDNKWVNSDLIDVYLRYICLHHSKTGRQIESISAYAILSYQNMKKLPTHWDWNLADVNYVLVPAHLNKSHWGLVLVDVHQRKVTMYDSLNHRITSNAKQEFSELIVKIFTELVERESLGETHGGDWTTTEDFDVPQQPNGTDCGIYCMLYALYFAVEMQFTFTQLDIAFFRRQICYDLTQEIIKAAYHQQEGVNDDEISIISADVSYTQKSDNSSVMIIENNDEHTPVKTQAQSSHSYRHLDDMLFSPINENGSQKVKENSLVKSV